MRHALHSLARANESTVWQCIVHTQPHITRISSRLAPTPWHCWHLHSPLLRHSRRARAKTARSLLSIQMRWTSCSLQRGPGATPIFRVARSSASSVACKYNEGSTSLLDSRRVLVGTPGTQGAGQNTFQLQIVHRKKKGGLTEYFLYFLIKNGSDVYADRQ